MKKADLCEGGKANSTVIMVTISISQQLEGGSSGVWHWWDAMPELGNKMQGDKTRTDHP